MRVCVILSDAGSFFMLCFFRTLLLSKTESKKINGRKLTEGYIDKRGCNKSLTMEGDVKVSDEVRRDCKTGI